MVVVELLLVAAVVQLLDGCFAARAWGWCFVSWLIGSCLVV